MKRITLTLVMISVAAAFACAQGIPARDYSSQKIELLKKNALSQIHFVPLEVGEISPQGWIRDWADLALDGITGHLDEYQPVYMHGWKGYGFKARGTNPEDGTRWPIEQCSYWMDGAVKLAYMTGDERLIKKITERLDIIVDGVLNGADTFIWWKDASIVKDWFNNWGHGIMGRALLDYYQATRSPRVLQALEKVYTSFYMRPAVYTGSIQHMMERNRGLTNADAMTELFLETGNTVILDSLRACASRQDTKEYFKQVASVSGRDKEGFRTLHGISLYEGLRVPAILGLWSGDADGYRTATHLHDWAMEYNALPYGIPSCEEWLSGAGGFHSVETCIVPASMWSYNWLLRLSGDTSWCDLIESVFINAGPGPIARDFKTMSYYQQPNRISENLPTCPPVPGVGDCTFTDHGHEVLCCVGSCNWIIPNYVGNMWQATMDGGLAYLLYGPCRVNTMIGNTSVKLDCSTAYPFGESVSVKVSLSDPIVMPMYFHVPSWCKDMSMKVNGRRQKLNAKDGLVCVSREWKDGDSIEISLPMEVSVVEGREIPYPREPYFLNPRHGLTNDLVADTEGGMPYEYVKYGPILFSLPIADLDENHVAADQKFNYALNIGNVRKDVKVTRHPMPAKWDWAIGSSPVTLEVKAGEFDWNPTQAQPMPKEKVSDYQPAKITLVPYNLTKFRISMFPVTETPRDRK